MKTIKFAILDEIVDNKIYKIKNIFDNLFIRINRLICTCFDMIIIIEIIILLFIYGRFKCIDVSFFLVLTSFKCFVFK